MEWSLSCLAHLGWVTLFWELCFWVRLRRGTVLGMERSFRSREAQGFDEHRTSRTAIEIEKRRQREEQRMPTELSGKCWDEKRKEIAIQTREKRLEK